MQVAGTSGTVRLEDFVIPRNEKVAQFQVRDGHFLADNATRVSQAAEERTVSLNSPLRIQLLLSAANVGTPAAHCLQSLLGLHAAASSFPNPYRCRCIAK